MTPFDGLNWKAWVFIGVVLLFILGVILFTGGGQ